MAKRHEEVLAESITKMVLMRCGVERPTFMSWIKRYTVEGKPLGVKVGGRWRYYPDRLDKFLIGIRESKNPKENYKYD